MAEASEADIGTHPSNTLAELAFIGKQSRGDLLEEDESQPTNADAALVIDPTEHRQPKQLPSYSSWFTTQHRGPANVARFSPDGALLATGSADSTIKILDVQRIVTQHNEASEEKKVVKTLYDHTDAINDIQFHPNGFCLASASDDCNIKLFDLHKTHAKRAFRYLADAYPVKSISFHPSGDFLVSGTDHHAPRIYDIHTMRCFIPSTEPELHNAGILSVCCSSIGNIFASASNDGSIKLFDTVSSRCVNTISKAHGGFPVTSVVFSKSSKYLLSTGLDSIGKLWDMSTGKVLVSYKGASQKSIRANMAFTYNEDFVIGQDNSTSSISIWDSHTGLHLKNLSAHGKGILHVSSSLTDAGLISCG